MPRLAHWASMEKPGDECSSHWRNPGRGCDKISWSLCLRGILCSWLASDGTPSVPRADLRTDSSAVRAPDGAIPWRARDCARAATVHLAGTLEEIAEWEAHFTGPPFVILVQPSLFDPTRAPAGKHTAWAYCHVPNASTQDMTAAIEQQ